MARRNAGDLRDEARCRAVVDRAVSEFGRIDILVNNAAYQQSIEGGITDIDTEQFDRVFKTDVYAMYRLCRLALPHMPPGPVWTPLIPATMPAEKVREFGAQSPMGRAAQPAELAPAYAFFASQESSYITGEVLGVTGGMPVT